MQRIGEAWKRLPRVVRDLAQETGKPIELAVSGGETEVDRQVLQALPGSLDPGLQELDQPLFIE